MAFRLFIISAVMFLVSFVLAYLNAKFRFINSALIGFLATLSFGIGFAGTIVAIDELRKKKPKAWIGLIGNFSIAVLLAVIFILFS